ncbi:MAG: hypothetical protein LBR37_00970 [Erysipelotrichaceae bacterium]|jgi:hypothetical protein|nr:hypothetical protein [Erysipelotrichaceae bacterium]
MRELTSQESRLVTSGEFVITLATITVIFVIMISLVICYKLFMSKKGNATVPGGFKFEWN